MDLKLPTFDGIKDRLGFAEPADRQARSGRHAGADRTRQGDYDDYGYDDGYDDGYADGAQDAPYDDHGYDDGYGEYGEYGEYGYDDGYDDTPSAPAPYRPASTGSMPPLITADDVRAHTQYSPSVEPEPYPTRAQRLAAQSGSEAGRSEGLNSLFTSTAPATRPAAGATAARTSGFGSGAYSPQASVPPASSQVKPPVRSPLDDPKVIQRPTRILTVLKPEKYDEAERVAKILKAGDVAVLALRNTQPELAKRILDFSFGAASALDARVEFMGEQVFVISRGTALSEDERTRLRNQGVI